MTDKRIAVTALLATADHLEKHPDRWDYNVNRIPKNLTRKGCTFGWVTYFLMQFGANIDLENQGGSGEFNAGDTYISHELGKDAWVWLHQNDPEWTKDVFSTINGLRSLAKEIDSNLADPIAENKDLIGRVNSILCDVIDLGKEIKNEPTLTNRIKNTEQWLRSINLSLEARERKLIRELIREKPQANNKYKACACGVVPTNLDINVSPQGPSGYKLEVRTEDNCCNWVLSYTIGRQNDVINSAKKAWNEAPRS